MPLCLSDILLAAKAAMADGQTQHEVITKVGKVLWSNGLKMILEQIADSSDKVLDWGADSEEEIVLTKGAAGKGAEEPAVSSLDKLCNSIHGVPKLVLKDTVKVKRIILCDNKKNKCFNFYNNCVGNIIDAEKWEVISFAPRPILDRPSAKIVNAGLSKCNYNVIPIIDGTLVTLYPYLSGWCIASKNGYDVSPLKWSGPLSYSEIVYDLLTRLYPEFSESIKVSIDPKSKMLNFQGLDPGYCYTILFRHHNFHPIKSEAEGIWQICQTNLKTGLRGNGKFAVPDIASPPEQPSIQETADMTITELKKSKGYGYILQPKAGNSPDLLIACQKLIDVKKIVYNCSNATIEPEERNEYIAILAYLNGHPNRELFTKYFPEMVGKFNNINNFITATATTVIDYINKGNMCSSTDLIMEVAEEVESLQKEQKLPNIFTKEAESIIKDIITNPKYTVLIMREI